MIAATMQLAPAPLAARLARGSLPLLLLASLAAAPRGAAAHEPLAPSLAGLDRALRETPADLRLRLRRAELLRLAGAFDEAEAELDAVAALAPRLPGLDLARAQLALDRGDPDAALEELDRPGATGEPGGDRDRLRARALERVGRGEEALAAWDERLAAPGRPEPDDYLDRARLQLARGRDAEARAGLAAGLARLGPAGSLAYALEMLGSAPEAAGTRPAPPPAAASPGPVAGAITLTRGPYLQRASPTAITARWRTSDSTTGRAWFGSAPGSYTGSVDDSIAGTEHEVTFTALAPGTRYYYAVGSTSEVAAGGDSLTFRTPPAPGGADSVRIWVLGDSGLPGAAQNAVRDAFAAFATTREADVWLMLGDNAYSTGLDTEYQSGLFTPYRRQLLRWPLWPTRGNHDVTRSGAGNDYYEFFTLPTAAEAGGVASGSEAYYSFDHGPVHFVCLDSEGTSRAPGGAMLTWLALDLAANTRPWTIAFFHHPPYTKGSHDSDDVSDSGGRMRDMRENALPILEAGGVDLVLTGHSHSYERSFLLDGHYGTSGTLTPTMKKNPGDGRAGGDGPYGKPTAGAGPHEGAVYVVGGSGAQIGGGALDHPAMVSSLNVLGSLVVDVAGPRLDARFLSNLGAVRDSFTIVKGAAAAVAAPDVSGLARLGPAVPNPFRAGVTFGFSLPRAAEVRLDVFDASGRRVATVASGPHAAGAHRVHWEGRGEDGIPLAPGVYLARLEAEGRSSSRRVALVR